MITYNKLFGTIFQNAVVSLSNRLLGILLGIHEYNIRILCKPGLQLFITDWLSRHNHETNRDKETPHMCITISMIKYCKDILDSMTAEEIREVNIEDQLLSTLAELVLYG